MWSYAKVDGSDSNDHADEKSSFRGPWAALLIAEVWLSAVSWVAIISYFHTFYWHALNPRALGADYVSIGTYLVVMVVIPLLLEIPVCSRIPCLRVPCTARLSCIDAWSLALCSSLLVLVLGSAVTANERARSTGFLLAMLCVGLRMVSIVPQRAPARPQSPSERTVAPWSVSLGLLLVVVCRMAPATFHPTRQAGILIFILLSVLALVLKIVLSTAAEDEGANEIDRATCCGECGASLTAGFLLPTVLMLSLWLLDAPWAVAHFAGLYGPVFRFLFVLAFAVGIGQTLIFPKLFEKTSLAAAFLMAELLLGSVLLCIPKACFFGGCLLTLAAPGAWLLALQLAGVAVQGRAAGRTLSLASFVLLVQIFCYMGTLVASTPVVGAYFWSKFWLFTVVLSVCLCTTFAGIIFNKAKQETSHSLGSDITLPLLTSGLVLAFLVVLSAVVSIMAARAPIMAPQQTSRGLVVGSYNIQQGYQLDGLPNYECVASALQAGMPHIVGLQESDSVHVVSGNTNILGYVAEKLGWHRTVGPAGSAASVGVSILSQYMMRNEMTQQLPPTVGGPVNRFLVRSSITVNGTDVTVFSVHTEWFGDPGVQIAFVADVIGNTTGPIVLVGDFNLDVSGQNDATIAANITSNGFQKLLDLASTGLKSATPLHTIGKCNMTKSAGIEYCPGNYTTVVMGAQGANSTPGYQLDYIWYRGLVQVGGLTVIEQSKGCSDHLLVQATFSLP